MNNVRRFFEDKQNYDAVRKMCRNAFRDKDDAMDALHDMFLKAEENKVELPDNREEALGFLHRMILRNKIDMLRKKKQLPAVLEEHYARYIEHDGGPGHAEKLDMLNDFMRLNEGLFTEDQLTLWHCLRCDLSSEQIQIVMKKDDRQAIYSLVYKLMEKIKKHFKYEELF